MRTSTLQQTLSTVLLLLTTNAVSQVDDSCRDVLTHSARTYSLETYDLSVALRVYNQHCENDAVRSGTSFDAGVDAVIKAVPAKFRLNSGSTEERAKHFCKTFDSDYKKNESAYKSISQVVNETTNAWLACKTLASQGVLFRPRISATQIVIEVARTNAAPASVEGITYDRTLLDCSAPNTDKSKGRTSVSSATTKALSDAYWPITCIRTPKVQQRETIYPKVDISVGTTRGAFLFPVAAEALYPYQWASDVQKQIDEVKTSAQASKGSVVELQGRLNNAPASAWQPEQSFGGGASAVSKEAQCPAGHVMVGLEVVTGGTCRQQCDPDGRAFHKFKVKCAPRY